MTDLELKVESTLNKISKNVANSFSKAWEEITGTARAVIGVLDPDLPKQDLHRLYKQMSDCVTSKSGEVTARNNTITLGKMYLDLSKIGKTKFFILLLEKFEIDSNAAKEAVDRFQTDPNHHNQQLLITALTAPRHKILKQFSALSNGLKFIVDLRSNVLKLIKTHPEFLTLETDLRNVLLQWFDVGLLDMRHITWQSSASLLEKLIAYEAVHEISSWNDLRNRLDSDRRCFAFFHHNMPEEPLIFLEVALSDHIATNIRSLLDESAPTLDQKNINTAIFYSISNAQHGLKGINLGNFLIKKVVQELSHELSTIKTFVTLSPIPGFATWLTSNMDILELSDELKKQIADTALIIKEFGRIKKELMQLCAYYLLQVKKGINALDPVANFHLTNGAMIRQINWNGDDSSKGINESIGMMVNYHYELKNIDNNHENYMSAGMISSTRTL